MANRPAKTQQNYIYGIVVRTPYDSGTLKEVILPELDGETYVIAAPDIPGENRIEVYGTEVPIFADSKISYKGQAVLAMFSDDKTDLEIKAGHVRITCEEAAEVDLNSGVFHTERYHFQESKPEILADAVTVETSFESERITKDGIDVLSIRVFREDDLIIVDAPTKWSALLRRTVSDVLGIPLRNVRHRPDINMSSMDDTIFEPIIVSGIAAVAMKKTGRPVRIDFQCDAFSNKVQVRRKTVLTKDGIPILETVSAKIDQGAFPIFSKEVCNQVLAGVLPPYQPQQLDIEVRSVFSNTYPTAFFSGMGFNIAMQSCCRHMTRIARKFGINTVEWCQRVIDLDFPSPKTISVHNEGKIIQKMAKEIIEASDYSHRDSVYSMQSKIPLSERRFYKYSRGIGIAFGPAVNGFSNELNTKYKISMTLESNDRVFLNIGLPQDKDSVNLWKKCVADEMGFDKKNISLLPPDDDSINDSGPDCLSRDTGIIPKFLRMGCDIIKKKRFNEPLPISVDIPLTPGPEEGKVLFNTHSWCIVVAEVELDMTLFRPVVRHVWTAADFGSISDERSLSERFSHVISNMISTFGYSCDLDKEGKSRFDIKLLNRNDGYTSSATPVLRALTVAAITSATEQALGAPVDKIPMHGEDIFKLLSDVKEGDDAAGTDN